MRSPFEPVGVDQKPATPPAAPASFKHRHRIVRRDSGVVMALGIAEALARAETGPSEYDGDGRRKIYVDERFRRDIVRAITLLKNHGLGMHIVCNMPKPDGTLPCGQPMQAIGEGTRDAGFACMCQRIYIR